MPFPSTKMLLFMIAGFTLTGFGLSTENLKVLADLDPTLFSPAHLLSEEANERLEAYRKEWLVQKNDWVKRRTFIYRGLTPVGTQPPVHQVADVSEMLAPRAPRQAHPYFSVDFQEALDKDTRSRLTAGNHTELLLNSASWERKSKLIGEATESVWASSMIMYCDEGGQAFAETMIAAAQRGVETRFILDGLFSFYASPCLQEMSDAGVQVLLSTRSLQPRTLDWEMHEKLLVIDGEVATIGGQNIGSWYQFTDGKDGRYRDTDVLLTGPIVGQIARRFATLWLAIQPDAKMELALIALDVEDAAWEAKGQLGQTHYGDWLDQPNPSGLCRLVAQDPHLGTFHVWTAYQAHIEAAQRRVLLTAYALDPMGSPTQESLRDSLVDLANRSQARVDILTNGSGVLESEVVPTLFQRTYARSILTQAWEGLGQTPVNLWTYNYFLHAKQYDFDGLAVGIGSFNYDASGNRCQESAVICMDPQLTDAMENAFAVDMANSVLVSDGLEQLPSEARLPKIEQRN